MKVPFVDTQSQYQEIKQEVDNAVLDVLASGLYVSGKHVQLLEEEIASSCGVKHGVACNSGTDALKIGLQAMGLREGDEVITTPFSFGATVEIIVQNGARPVFVDIDPKTFNMDVVHLKRAINERTRAIIPIHLFGQIADMEQIMKIANEHGLWVLEDAAQSIGSTRNNKHAGSFGHAAGISFYPTKNLGAAGDAGMIITNDDEIAERARALRVHGMKTTYQYEWIGHTSRLDEIQAAILRIKLQRLNIWNEARNRHAKIYDEILSNAGARTPFVAPETTYHNYHQYTIRHRQRDGLQRYLKDHGIATAIYYPSPLHLQPAYSFLGYMEGDFPETESACKEVLQLPVQQHLSTEQIEYVAETVVHFASTKANV